jgi:hypothetical protein
MTVRSVLGLLTILTVSCAEVTEAPVPGLSQVGQVTSPSDIVLSAGTEVRVDSLLRVGFVDVPADSRCPTSVMCVWAGDGHVVLGVGVGMGPSDRVHLHTTLDPRAADVSRYRITLLDLMPYPDRPGTIPLDAYAVRLHVERLAPPAGTPGR